MKKRFLTPRRKRILAGLALAAVIVYAVDDLSVRLGVPERPRFSTYPVRGYYYVHEKYNKFSYEPLPLTNERCVNALLPHMGSKPCWYLRRHLVVMIDVN